ncbi:XRE family transcriptional regulator [Stappia sp. GBMRC 2046]|uniref:XRE family transcriptional regulator n=2 Tax=Stappia sediminis TaxID=2692190 RepID=A0A7X3S847_9HYPH|nr:XRE family transcriptional regulator [Stappia sediminis]
MTEEFTVGSGDVFADIGVELSAQDELKIGIASAIARIVHERGLTQMQAARLVGTDQAKMSAILRGSLKGFSIDRLVRILVELGADLDIRISETKDHARGKIRIGA